MTNEEILANAPEGATHVHDEFFFKQDSKGFWLLSVADLWVKTTPVKPLRWIGDIRENIELKQKLEAAERERDELKQKQLEQLRLFTNALLRKFKSVDKISKIDINSFTSRRLNQLRQQLNGGE